jgi:two-component system, NtrC family, nitrogen regulation sensor histidine kinase GlnL
MNHRKSSIKATQALDYAALFDQLLGAVLVIDRDLAIDWCNAAAEELLQSSKRQLQELHLNEVLADVDLSARAVAYSLRSGNPYHQRDSHFQLLNGAEFTADISVSMLDASLNKKLLVELRQTDREHRIGLEASEYAQHLAASSLLRGLGHEIKNPLGGLRGAAQLLAMELNDLNDPKKLQELSEYTQVIIGEADRLSALVDRMLAPHKKSQASLTNIHQLTESVINLVNLEKADTPNLAIAWVRDYDPSLPELMLSADQIQQALLNLIQNAVQAAVVDNPQITIRTRAVRQMLLGKTMWRLVLRIDVIDDGPGVPDNIADKLFMPLISGRANGTGLGLGIAQSLIQQHQGLIDYQQGAAKTTFSIYLPVISDEGKDD